MCVCVCVCVVERETTSLAGWGLCNLPASSVSARGLASDLKSG